MHSLKILLSCQDLAQLLCNYLKSSEAFIALETPAVQNASHSNLTLLMAS